MKKYMIVFCFLFLSLTSCSDVFFDDLNNRDGASGTREGAAPAAPAPADPSGGGTESGGERTSDAERGTAE